MRGGRPAPEDEGKREHLLDSDYMIRHQEMSYPEKQCWQNIQESRRKEDWDAASPEEKEPTMKEDP